MGLSRQSRVPSKLDTYGFGSAQPLAGTEFGSLPDTAAMEVQINLPQIEAQGVAIGNAVELHPLGRPDQHFTSTSPAPYRGWPARPRRRAANAR